jgi:hypothetical protein
MTGLFLSQRQAANTIWLHASSPSALCGYRLQQLSPVETLYANVTCCLITFPGKRGGVFFCRSKQLLQCFKFFHDLKLKLMNR